LLRRRLKYLGFSFFKGKDDLNKKYYAHNNIGGRLSSEGGIEGGVTPSYLKRLLFKYSFNITEQAHCRRLENTDHQKHSNKNPTLSPAKY
jgi:hypothetical protein